MILVLINLSDKAIRDYKLTLKDSPLAQGSYTLTPLMGSGGHASMSNQPVTELAPFTTYIFQVK
jgi:hypothetical protein